MARPRFFFLEPSKVGMVHIGLIEGFLSALSSSTSIADSFELTLCASKSTLATLPSALISRFRCRPVPVMNPEKPRLIPKTFRLVLKSFVELFVVLRLMLRLRPGDKLFISCILPTTLWLLESVNRLLRRTGVHVVLHGEVEGLFEKSPQSFRRLGYWAVMWMRARKAESRLSLVVLDDFIRDKLVQEYPGKLNRANVSVIHLPVLPMHPDPEDDRRRFAVCLIGYRTRFKRFDEFSRMASERPAVTFLAIGGGKVENISAGTVDYLSDRSAYLLAISKCSVALFPYTSGYSCSLPASAVDALSAGVHILALDQPCFRSLAAYFGSDMATVCSSIEELGLELDRRALSVKQDNRAAWLDRVSSSKYGPAAVQRSFEKLAFNLMS